jgi:hypothetical protein
MDIRKQSVEIRARVEKLPGEFFGRRGIYI